MSVSIVQLGTPRAAGEGLRIGTVRRPPRGVPKSEFGTRNYYDVWLPILSPTPELVSEALAAKTDREWSAFARKFRAQMNNGDAPKVLDTLAALSKTADFSVGCYCDDENRCHRSILRQLLEDRGAAVKQASAPKRASQRDGLVRENRGIGSLT
ncbi:DUF488 family protein [Paraburkholderia sp. SARCC-3016]|uniref:DUF488 domain-containing protein n=1 Tax=Paraburkholderia sp. SARCC-3016 TaxID=3058611 RepID=UPI002808CD65|nr:DUF488 family protein [Paraburkholderia sp. SARCC-3016]MDQ7981780.1 DUF488 family protein [Paraburkholderia sp. SARCC-3016]